MEISKVEREAMRQLLKCEIMLKELKDRAAQKTKPLTARISAAREVIGAAAAEAPNRIIKLANESYARIKRASTVRKISQDIVRTSILDLPDPPAPGDQEEQQQQPKAKKRKTEAGGGAATQEALHRAILAAVRAARTSYHDALDIVEAPPRGLAEVTPASPAVKAAAAELAAAKAALATARRNAQDARAVVVEQRAQIDAVVTRYLRRTHKEKLNISYRVGEEEEGGEEGPEEPFNLRLEPAGKPKPLSAKAFSAIAEAAIKKVRVAPNLPWREALADAVIAGMLNYEDELLKQAAASMPLTGGMVVKATRPRGRRAGPPEDGEHSDQDQDSDEDDDDDGDDEDE
jgi:hypothetical protein